MGLLDNTTQQSYYEGSNHGSYQFVSLEDIIKQFMVIYVGEDKIIPKARRLDVAFHAQRALAELSFDTFKSVKSQQIDIPNSLTMILPHDYVNYTKVSWTDDAGIKHLLYPTRHTSNPFQIRQHENGNYDFPESFELVINGDFSDDLTLPWVTNFSSSSGSAAYTTYGSDINITSSALTFSDWGHDSFGVIHGLALAAWQEIDVSQTEYIDLSANGTSVAAVTTGDLQHPGSNLRVGISTGPGDTSSITVGEFSSTYSHLVSRNYHVDLFDLQTTATVAEPSYIEWTSGDSGSKELLGIDVRGLNTVYVVVTSHVPFTTGYDSTQAAAAASVDLTTNTIDNISVENSYTSGTLQPKLGNEKESSTWKNYKSTTPSENNNDDYEDEVYWPYEGERYGLDPTHAQANGSFYIDERFGKIHFSSNMSGKTIILDYISDSLGTDNEMKVHKLAEDAMYKHILCDIMSTRANVGRGQLQYYKKDKFAAVRKAKLRLSNIKLEELTQILRGKSKWIKH